MVEEAVEGGRLRTALTREEWKNLPVVAPLVPVRLEYLSVGNRHALAALCLHGQEFGFTWEDVEDLRRLPIGYATEAEYVAAQTRYRDLADRIEALLPPLP